MLYEEHFLLQLTLISPVNITSCLPLYFLWYLDSHQTPCYMTFKDQSKYQVLYFLKLPLVLYMHTEIRFYDCVTLKEV
jgi:hypothetical protein